jgi:hypothetical protein
LKPFGEIHEITLRESFQSNQFLVPRFTSNSALRRHAGQMSHSRFRA